VLESRILQDLRGLEGFAERGVRQPQLDNLWTLADLTQQVYPDLPDRFADRVASFRLQSYDSQTIASLITHPAGLGLCDRVIEAGSQRLVSQRLLTAKVHERAYASG